jgi:hypothetical protein
VSKSKISDEAKDIMRKMLIHNQSAKAEELLNHPFITKRLNQKENNFLVNFEKNFAKIECFKALIKNRREKIKLIKSNLKNFENLLDFNDESYPKKTFPKLIIEYSQVFNISEKSSFYVEKTNKELLEEENANFNNQEKKFFRFF